MSALRYINGELLGLSPASSGLFLIFVQEAELVNQFRHLIVGCRQGAVVVSHHVLMAEVRLDDEFANPSARYTRDLGDVLVWVREIDNDRFLILIVRAVQVVEGVILMPQPTV